MCKTDAGIRRTSIETVIANFLFYNVLHASVLIWVIMRHE